MGATQLTCPLPYAVCASRRAKQPKPALRSRLVTIAIALAVLCGMYNGERWLLEHSPASANELVVATCVVDVVFGDGAPKNLCAGAGTGGDSEPQSE